MKVQEAKNFELVISKGSLATSTPLVDTSAKASERNVIRILCSVREILYQGGAVQIFCVPLDKCRMMTVAEGQRPVSDEKVQKITSQILENPNVTVGTHSLLALDFTWTPPDAALVLSHIRDAKYGIKMFSTLGGNHYLLGFLAALEAKPDLERDR